MTLKNIFYVIGSPRSGSVLIYNSLCASKIFNPSLPENHLVPYLVELFIKQIERNQVKEKNLIFNSNNEIQIYFKECIQNFFRKVSKKYNTQNLCFKSILFATNIHIMNIIFPEVKFIMTVRDPRDIIASMLQVSDKQKKSNITPQYPRNMKVLSDFINKQYHNFFNHKNSEFFKNSVFIAKYEDFVLHHKETLNEIMQKFDIDFSFKEIHDYWQNSLNLSNESNSFFKSELWGKPISNKKIGSYKDILSTAEIDDINSYCKEIINYFDY